MGFRGVVELLGADFSGNNYLGVGSEILISTELKLILVNLLDQLPCGNKLIGIRIYQPPLVEVATIRLWKVGGNGMGKGGAIVTTVGSTKSGFITYGLKCGSSDVGRLAVRGN